jgi:cation diffusion facilitator family transporter
MAIDYEARGRATIRAATVAVVSNSVLIGAKFAAGMLCGSVAVLSEALHSANDLAASLIAFVSVRKASQPADRSHPYGHGKFESLSGLIEAVLIFVAAGAIVYMALRRAAVGGVVEHGWVAAAAMGGSAIVNLVVSTYLLRVAREHDSIALEADAWHLRTDAYTCGGVFAGMGAIALGAPAVIDPIVALPVGLLIIHRAYALSRDALGQLLDRALPADEQQQILGIVAEHGAHFVEFHGVRSRRAGGERHIDLHLVMCRGVPVGEAHALADHIEHEVSEAFRGTHVMMHIEPCTGNETLQCRVSGRQCRFARRVLEPVGTMPPEGREQE